MVKKFLNDILKIANTPFKKLCIIGVMVLPLSYSMIYLAAMWDPYNNLNNIPVAVVNEDNGATIFNSGVNVGADLVKELAINGTLKWKFVDNYDEAVNGTYTGKYYMLIHIPKDFSECLVSVAEGNAKKATLEYTVNEKNNYIMSMISEGAMKKIKDEIKGKIYETVAQKLDTILKNYNELSGNNNGMTALANGTNDMYNGVKELSKSVDILKHNLGENNESYIAAIDDVKADVGKIKNKTTEWQTDKENTKKDIEDRRNRIAQIKSDVNNLKTNPKEFTKDVTEKVRGVINSSIIDTPTVKVTNDDIDSLSSSIADGITSGVQSIVDDKFSSIEKNISNTDSTIFAIAKAPLKSISASIKTQLSNNTSSIQKAVYNALIETKPNVNTVSSELTYDIDSSLKGSINAINKNISDVLKDSLASMDLSNFNGDIDSLDSSLAKAEKSLDSLDDNITETVNSAYSFVNKNGDVLKSSFNALSSASEVMSNSANGIATGVGGLANATNAVADGVDKFDKFAGKLLNGSEGRAETFAEPISIENKHMYEVSFYAQGLAPYFISLSLWVGSIAIFFILKAKNVEKVSLISKLFVMDIISIVQAFISCFVTQYVLKMHIASPILFYMFTILSALTFMCIVRGLMMIFMEYPQIGEFVAIILLMLQLTSCGGLYPIETSPLFFRILNKFLPMTYSVRGMKEAMFGMYGTILLNSTLVMFTFIIIFQPITYFFAWEKYKDKPKVFYEQLTFGV